MKRTLLFILMLTAATVLCCACAKPADGVPPGEQSAVNDADARESESSEGELSFDAECISIGGYTNESLPPEVSVIRSSAEMDDFYDAYNDSLYLGRVSEYDQQTYCDVTRGFLDARDEYTDAFFETHDLLIVYIRKGTCSFVHEVRSVSRGKERVVITIESALDGPAAEAEGVWLMLIDMEKAAVSPEDEFSVVYIGDNY